MTSERDDHDCRTALAAMYLFLDSEQLSTADRDDIQSHLDDCLPCLEAFEFEAELKHMLAKRCKDQAPARLYERIRVSLRVEIESALQDESMTTRKHPEEGIPEA